MPTYEQWQQYALKSLRPGIAASDGGAGLRQQIGNTATPPAAQVNGLSGNLPPVPAIAPAATGMDKISPPNYYGPDEEWAKPAEPSALGNWLRGVGSNYNRYGTATPGNRLPMPDFIANNTGVNRPDMPEQVRSLGGLQNAPIASANNPPARGLDKVAPPNTYTPQQMASSVPPDRLPGMAAASQRYGLSQQGYDPMGQGTDLMRRVSGGTTTYQQPGLMAMGGNAPGYAAFQGLPSAPGQQGTGWINGLGVTPHPMGGFVGSVGTPETANMTQRQATDYNVANLNRQTEALRSLREARNPGITTGQNQGAFGDLVSIGRPGGNFGDEAMQAEHARSAIQRGLSSAYLNSRERQTMIAGGQALAGLPTPPSVNRLPASGLGAIDPYKLAQLGLDRSKFGLEQQKFGLDQQQQQFNQGQTRMMNDSLMAHRQALANRPQTSGQKPLGLEQVKAGMANQMLQTWQDSMNPAASPEQRAQAMAYLKQQQDFFNPYLGVQAQPESWKQ
ncbi:MAG: hypothetical protein WBO35_03790 [Candidatus Saccharimonadales bacterium]